MSHPPAAELGERASEIEVRAVEVAAQLARLLATVRSTHTHGRGPKVPGGIRRRGGSSPARPSAGRPPLGGGGRGPLGGGGGGGKRPQSPRSARATSAGRHLRSPTPAASSHRSRSPRPHPRRRGSPTRPAAGIEAPWPVNGGHGTSLRHHNRSLPRSPTRPAAGRRLGFGSSSPQRPAGTIGAHMFSSVPRSRPASARAAGPRRQRSPQPRGAASAIPIEAPWLVNGGHGASLRHHNRSLPRSPRRAPSPAAALLNEGAPRPSGKAHSRSRRWHSQVGRALAAAGVPLTAVDLSGISLASSAELVVPPTLDHSQSVQPLLGLAV
jgi:hypothetical protein